MTAALGTTQLNLILKAFVELTLDELRNSSYFTSVQQGLLCLDSGTSH